MLRAESTRADFLCGCVDVRVKWGRNARVGGSVVVAELFDQEAHVVRIPSIVQETNTDTTRATAQDAGRVVIRVVAEIRTDLDVNQPQSNRSSLGVAAQPAEAAQTPKTEARN
jgi:hypothetical protein